MKLFLLFITLLLMHPSAFANDYYLSNKGNDTYPGTKSKPWRSIAKANTTVLKPGDRLLFAGGESFEGSLIIHALSSTAPGNSLAVSSYGKGKATLLSGKADGILIKNLGNISLSNIIVKGADRTSNTGYGIKIFNEKGDKKLENIKILNCEASGFRWSGIFVGGNPTDLPKVSAIEGSRYGYKNVVIKNCSAYENMYYGIYMTAQWNPMSKEYGNENVEVVDCVAFNNHGDPTYTANHSGSGIMIDDTFKTLIEYCVAYRNGALNAGITGGPCGIWAHFSDSVTIQYCETYENKTAGAADGGGFDLDGGVTNSVIQYCYSHDNDGAGYLMWNYDQAPSKLSNSTIRYCISANDGRKHGYGGIHIGTSGLPVTNIDVYHNTIIMPEHKDNPRGIWVGGGAKNENFRFFNNLIITKGITPLLEISPSTNFLFAGNAYWNSDNKFGIKYYEKEYKSLEDWRQGSNQESYKNTASGLSADPLIKLPPENPIVGDPHRLRFIKAFNLKPGSPLARKGVDLTTFGIRPPGKDFAGTRVPENKPDIGAFQLKK